MLKFCEKYGILRKHKKVGNFILNNHNRQTGPWKLAAGRKI